MTRIAHADELLASVPLFATCSAKELKHISSLVVDVKVPAGKELMTEGEAGQEAYIVVSGTARVTLAGVQIATVSTGDPLGEMTLLDRTLLRSATVTSETEMELLVLDPRAFSDLLDQHPSVTRKIAVVLARRLRALEGSRVS